MKELFKKIVDFITPEPLSIRDNVVNSIYEDLKAYSKWYDEQGLYLPRGFETRPADWSEEMHKMVDAFGLLYDEMYYEGELHRLNTSPVALLEEEQKRLDELQNKIQEGLSSFGKNFIYMTDSIKEKK